MYLKSKRPTKGFTLIEMLVVIAIIGILASIAFPLTRSVINKGKVTETKTRMQEFEFAVNAYRDDNGHLPSPDAEPSGPKLTDEELVEIINILLSDNPKSKKYLSMPNAKNGTNGITFEDDTNTTVTGMTDAWGNNYDVIIDYDLDGVFDSVGTEVIMKNVILTSPGIDLEIGGDSEDDIKSWE